MTMYSPLSDLPTISNVMWGGSSTSRKYQIKRENEFDYTNVNPICVGASLTSVKRDPGAVQNQGYSNPQSVKMESTVQESSISELLTPPVSPDTVLISENQTPASPSELQPPAGFKMPSKDDLVFTEGKITNVKNCDNVEETIKYLYVLYNKTAEENAKGNFPTVGTGANLVVNSNTPPISPFHDIFQLAQEGLKPSQPTPNVLSTAAPNMPWMQIAQQNFYQNPLMNIQPGTSYQQNQFGQSGMFLRQQNQSHQQVQNPQIRNNDPVVRINANLQKDTQENGRTRVNNALKTVFSYDYLVFLALLNTPTGRMTVTEMFPFVQKYFYNFGNTDSWKSSLRHALNAKYRYCIKDGVCGKSAVYKINPDKMDQLHNGIRKIVEKYENNPEALRLKNINDLTALLNGTAEFSSKTHLVMRNQKPNVPARAASLQVCNVASPYMRPQAPVHQYAVQHNLVHQNQPWMNQYLPGFFDQQFNHSLNQPMLPHSFNMASAPGSSMMFQAPQQNQFLQQEAVQFATDNNEFLNNTVQFEEGGPAGDVVDENGVNDEYIDIGEGELVNEEEYYEVQENEQYEFVDDVLYTELETINLSKTVQSKTEDDGGELFLLL